MAVKLNRHPTSRRAALAHQYGVALLAVSFAALLCLLGREIGDATCYLVAATLVFLITWYRGLGWALLTAFLAALVIGVLALPLHRVIHSEDRLARLTVFLLMAGVVSGIIESHKRATLKLQESEARFRAAYEHAQVGIEQFALDAHLRDVNPKLCEISGYTREELLERTSEQITYPADLVEEKRQLSRLLAGEIPSYTIEKRYLRKNEELVWVRLTSSLTGSTNTAGTYRISIIEDISVQRYAREALRFLAEAGTLLASSLDYQATAEHVARLVVPSLADWCAVDIVSDDGLPERVAISHMDSVRAEWERELERRFPSDAGAMLHVAWVLRTGQAISYPQNPDVPLAEASMQQELAHMLREMGISSVMVVPLIARGRTLGALSLVSAQSGRRYGADDLTLAKDLAHRAALAIDNARLYREAEDEIARRKKLEEQLRQHADELQEADRQKDTFLAMLGHELRTPLTVISNALELFRRQRGSAAVHEGILERIERQSRRMARLIDDMQDVTRISQGRILLRRVKLDLAQLVQVALEDLHSMFKVAGLTLAVEMPETPVVVDGDPDRLIQVLTNLLDNAARFTDPGGRIAVRLSSNLESATLTVQDTGIGIDAGILPRVFDSFIQAEHDLGRTRGGLGLGLSLVKGLVELHGGEVHAASVGRGCGAEFTVRLPLETLGLTQEETGAGAADRARL
jgi:PAS domain S-box-containing protein